MLLSLSAFVRFLLKKLLACLLTSSTPKVGGAAADPASPVPTPVKKSCYGGNWQQFFCGFY